MTTIIIDPNTKAIYTDSRATCTGIVKGNTDNVLFSSKTRTEILNHECITKCHYINDSVGYVCCTGDTIPFQVCLKLSNSTGQLELPELTKYTDSCTLINVKRKGDCIEVFTYNTKEKKRFFYNEYYWEMDYYLLTKEPLFFGSGKYYTEGAYRAGINPKDCIVAASLCDGYTDNNVKIYEL